MTEVMVPAFNRLEVDGMTVVIRMDHLVTVLAKDETLTFDNLPAATYWIETGAGMPIRRSW